MLFGLLKPSKLTLLGLEQFGPDTHAGFRGKLVIVTRKYGTIEIRLPQHASDKLATSLHVCFKPHTERPWLSTISNVSKTSNQSNLIELKWSVHVGAYQPKESSPELVFALLGGAAPRAKQTNVVAGSFDEGELHLHFAPHQIKDAHEKWANAMAEVHNILPLFEELERELPHTPEDALITLADVEPDPEARQHIYAEMLALAGKSDAICAHLREKLTPEPDALIFHLAEVFQQRLLDVLDKHRFTKERAIRLAQFWRDECAQNPSFAPLMMRYVFSRIPLKHLSKHDLPHFTLLRYHWQKKPTEAIQFSQQLFEHMNTKELWQWFELTGKKMNGAQRRTLVEHILQGSLERTMEEDVLEYILLLATEDTPAQGDLLWWKDLLPHLTHALTSKSTRMLAQLADAQDYVGGTLSLSDTAQLTGDLSMVHQSKGQLSAPEDTST
jgi:hypothetical protein